MESTSSPDHGRQSRGLARFWPVHGTPAPEQRQSEDEAESSSEAGSPAASLEAGSPAAASSSQAGSPAAGDQSAAGSFATASLPEDSGPVAGSGPTGEQPQVDTVRPGARAGETHIVALGSRRLPEIVNGGRPSGQGGFPPPETERDVRAAEPSPRHGGQPIPTALPLPPSRPPFGSMGPGAEAEADGGAPFRPASSPFGAGSPFASPSPFGLRGLSEPGRRGPTSADAAGAGRSDAVGRLGSGGPATGRVRAGGPDRADRDGGAHSTASGWASLPTSGIPTLASSTSLAGGSTIDEAAAGAPAAGSPAAESTASATTDSASAGSRPFGRNAADGNAADGNAADGSAADGSAADGSAADGSAADDGPAVGGRRSRHDEPQMTALRRSTTLDDVVEPRPRAGRRAAPDTADELDGRTDRRSPSSGGDSDRDREDGSDTPVKRDDRAPAGPNADRKAPENGMAGHADAAHTTTDPDDTARTDAGRDDAAHTTADPDDDTRAAADRDDAARATAGQDGAAGAEAGRDDTEANGGGKTGTVERDDADPADTDAKTDAPMRPGDVDETLIAFWDDKAIERFRSEWHEVKADFVDDPVAALTRAHDLITEAVDDLTEALLAERDELDPLRTTSTPDTESMRMAMRGYREFLDRILAL